MGGCNLINRHSIVSKAVFVPTMKQVPKHMTKIKHLNTMDCASKDVYLYYTFG